MPLVTRTQTAIWLLPDRRLLRSEMRKAGLSAVQLRRQVARHFHTGFRFLDRRLEPLTHILLLSRVLNQAMAGTTRTLNAVRAVRTLRLEYAIGP